MVFRHALIPRKGSGNQQQQQQQQHGQPKKMVQNGKFDQPTVRTFASAVASPSFFEKGNHSLCVATSWTKPATLLVSNSFVET